MPGHRLPACSLFINLHRSLLIQSFAVDMAFLAMGIGYMLFPSTELTYSIPNGIFLFMTVLIFVAMQVRLLRSHTGDVAFYRQLPVSGMPLVLVAKTVTIIPFLIILLLSVLIICLIGIITQYPTIPSPHLLMVRAFHVLVIFAAMKSFVAPTMLLSKKHPLFLGAFYLSLMPIIFCVMALHEFFFSHLQYALVWDCVALLVLMLMMELWVIRNAR